MSQPTIRDCFRTATRKGQVFFDAGENGPLLECDGSLFDGVDYELGVILADVNRRIGGDGVLFRKWLTKGARLPYPSACFFYEVDSIAFAFQCVESAGVCEITLLQKRPNFLEWYICPCMLIVRHETAEKDEIGVALHPAAQCLAEHGKLSPQTVEKIADLYSEEMLPHLGFVGAILECITNRDVDVRMGAVTEAARRNNRARAGRKLPPLPPVRTLDLTRVEYISVQREKEARASPRPHERAGHFRHYRSGLEIWVKATKVRGGGEPPAYQINFGSGP